MYIVQERSHALPNCAIREDSTCTLYRRDRMHCQIALFERTAHVHCTGEIACTAKLRYWRGQHMYIVQER